MSTDRHVVVCGNVAHNPKSTRAECSRCHASVWLSPTTPFPHVSEEDGGGIGRCMCSVCIRWDWDALDDDRPTLAAFRAQQRGWCDFIVCVDCARRLIAADPNPVFVPPTIEQLREIADRVILADDGSHNFHRFGDETR